MNTKPYIVSIVALFLVLLPFSQVYGATFLSPTDEVASIRSEVEGDAYAAGNSVVITAPVNGDIFAAGDNIDISGSSSASVFAAGRNISISGEVQDDIRVAGSIISIASTIAHDLFAAGSSVLIAKDSHVHGDAYLAGENITISGTVHGNVRAAGNAITLTSDAVVMGDITTRGSAPALEDGATVTGTIKTIAPEEMKNAASNRFSFGRFLSPMISAAVFALVLLFAAPALVTKGKEFSTNSPVQSGLTGAVWIFAFIPAFIVLAVSGIGTHIGILVLLATLPLLSIGFGVMVVVAGSTVYRLIAKNEGTPWHHAFIGAILISLVGLLGFVGFIVLLVGFLVAFGGVLRTFWGMMQGK